MRNNQYSTLIREQNSLDQLQGYQNNFKLKNEVILENF